MKKKDIIKQMLPYVERARNEITDGNREVRRDAHGNPMMKSDNALLIELNELIKSARRHLKAK